VQREQQQLQQQQPPRDGLYRFRVATAEHSFVCVVDDVSDYIAWCDDIQFVIDNAAIRAANGSASAAATQ
jgi:hypothetical protein